MPYPGQFPTGKERLSCSPGLQHDVQIHGDDKRELLLKGRIALFRTCCKVRWLTPHGWVPLSLVCIHETAQVRDTHTSSIRAVQASISQDTSLRIPIQVLEG